jgi:hypothetical protein
VVQLQIFYQDVSGGPVDVKFAPPYQISLANQPGWYYVYINTAPESYNTTEPYTLTVTRP